MCFMATPSQVEIMLIGHFQAVPTQVLPKHGQKVISNILSSYSHKWLCPGSVQRKWQDAATHPWMNFWGWKPWARLFDG
jgi:hypothetical protein